jgi:hypothetical protein
VCHLHEYDCCMRKTLQKPAMRFKKEHIFTSVLTSASWEIYHVVGNHVHIADLFFNNFIRLECKGF